MCEWGFASPMLHSTSPAMRPTIVLHTVTAPPAALVSTRKMRVDPRAAPAYGERVRYLVVYRGPNARLVDQVVPPEVYATTH